MPRIKHPLLAYRRARGAFRQFRVVMNARKAGKEMTKMLNGKKTYIGIAIMVVSLVMSWLGIDDSGLAEKVVTDGAALVGSIVAIYGRYAAKPKG